MLMVQGSEFLQEASSDVKARLAIPSVNLIGVKFGECVRNVYYACSILVSIEFSVNLI